jgi:hypothetical protein
MAGDGARGVSEVGLSILARRPKLMGLVVFTCVAALLKNFQILKTKTLLFLPVYLTTNPNTIQLQIDYLSLTLLIVSRYFILLSLIKFFNDGTERKNITPSDRK